MNLSEYAANAILDGTAMPATLYLQLHNGNPGTAGTANVSSTTDRKSFTRDTAAAGVTQNAAIIEWLTIVADETLTHVTAWDAATSGNVWWIGPLVPASPVASSVGANVPDGELTFTIASWS